jgi:hypothetical protein
MKVEENVSSFNITRTHTNFNQHGKDIFWILFSESDGKEILEEGLINSEELVDLLDI